MILLKGVIKYAASTCTSPESIDLMIGMRSRRYNNIAAITKGLASNDYIDLSSSAFCDWTYSTCDLFFNVKAKLSSSLRPYDFASYKPKF